MPALKVERFSYPVITGSAARAILDRVYRNNSMTWDIVAVDVLSPIQYMSIMRNELKRQPILKNRLNHEATASIEHLRAQRITTCLRDPAWTIWARAVIDPGSHGKWTVEAIHSIMRRRLARGQCRERPCLGGREFVGYFRKATLHDQPIRDENRRISSFLVDMHYPDRTDPNNVQPVFAEVEIREGRMLLPQSQRAAAYERGGR